MMSYGQHWVDDLDISAVVAVLQSDWLTTGPKVQEFEHVVAQRVHATHGVALSSGTAGLHAAMNAIGLQPGDEVILPPLTFVATANVVVMEGGMPVFADVDPHTLLLDPLAVESKVTHRTKAIMAVDYAGQACDYDALRTIADRHGLALIADACHSLGGKVHGRPVGSLADLTVFSFHPVKTITTGEGGMVVTSDAGYADRMRIFRNHGITSDHRQRSDRQTWEYEMVRLGMNYRLTDFQCALGLSQFSKLDNWITRRQAVAAHYDDAWSTIQGIDPLQRREGVSHAYHLYVVKVDSTMLGRDRAELFARFRDRGIGVNVHYIPVHLQPYYRDRFGTRPGMCPVAEAAYERLLSLPIFPMLREEDVEHVVDVVRAVGRPCPVSV